ncbi:MAG: bifunctional phosphoribosylaminoimidazolecarboxamide formyltransferase/IMP cyclohydrolase, partial [Bifidobacterium aquikefiri]
VKPIFTEVIVAPAYDEEALSLLQTKKNLRILRVANPPKTQRQLRQIDGGMLVQSKDMIDAPGDRSDTWQLVAGSAADDGTLRDLEFAWRAIRSVKSNAILIASDQATVGIGMGQVNRVDSSQLAVTRANTLADGANRTQGAVAASDAFFPFPDGFEILSNAGVKAVVQPGGSIRDEAVFESAKKAGVTMYVTGTRHFFH